jgi:hypothetical protein
MNLENLITTIDSQIPIVALEVLSPEEATIIEWLTTTVQEKLQIPVFFWNLGVNGLEQCLIASDGGLVFKPVPEYKRPAHVDPLIYVFEYIQNFDGVGVFILGDIHPFVVKNSPQLSWEILTRIKNLYHRLKPTDKRIILLGQNIQLEEALVRLIPYFEVPLPTVEQIQQHLEFYLQYLKEAATEQEECFSVVLTAVDKEALSRAALGLTLEEVSDFFRLTVKQSWTKEQGVVVDNSFIPKAVEYKTRLLSQMGIELGKPATIGFGGLDLLREWLQRLRRLFTTEARSLSLPQPKGVLLAGPPGCQPAGSKVLMADGRWKNIEDIQVGDFVLSPQKDNTMISSQVIQTVSYSDRDIYKVSMKSVPDRFYYCSDDHIIPHISLRRQRIDGKRPRSQFLNELSVKDFLKRGSYYRNKAKIFSSSAYDLLHQELTVHPYVLGCFLGNGSLRKYSSQSFYTPSITESKREVIDKMIQLGMKLGKEYVQANHNTSRYYAVKETRQQFNKLFPDGVKASTKFVPSQYKYASLEQRLWLLAGLIDTDGTNCEFGSMSQQLTADFAYLIHSIGGWARLKKETKTFNGKQFEFYRVHYAVGEIAIPTQVKYKTRKVRNIKWKNHRHRQVVVELTNTKSTVYGFTIDSESHWYVTDNWLVTHNCGKSLIAKNVADVLQLPLLQLDIASMLGSLVGESEGNVRRALKTAEAIAPCVLWIDEIEKALSGQGDSSGVSHRILGNLLTFMSECTSGVFVVATCNDPSALPSELKRKGRFDENFFVDLPTLPERVQILKIHLQRFGITVEDEYVEAIASSTAKFSGAELETLASEAALLAFDEGRPQQVSLGDLEVCRQTITPLAVQDALAVERMRDWAKTARAASSAIADKPTQSLRTARFRNLN